MGNELRKCRVQALSDGLAVITDVLIYDCRNPEHEFLHFPVQKQNHTFVKNNTAAVIDTAIRAEKAKEAGEKCYIWMQMFEKYSNMDGKNLRKELTERELHQNEVNFS